jgi:hypothetical protein
MSIYTQLPEEDIVNANPTTITTGLWSDDSGSLNSENGLFLNDTQLAASGDYYVDVYDKSPTNPTAEVQFSIAYGHINGGGAPTLEVNDLAKLPTKAIYSQYRNLLLDPNDTKFSFNGVDSDHIYVINIQRARIREQLDPGNWELPLLGRNGLSRFIDNSGQALGALTATSKAGRVFDVVSGSLTGVSASVPVKLDYNGIGYGKVYPDLGIIILNPDAIGPEVGFYVTSGSVTTDPTGSAAAANQKPWFPVGTRTSPGTGTAATLQGYTTRQGVIAPITSSGLTAEDDWPTGTIPSAYNHFSLFVSLNTAIKDTTQKGFQARSAETISSTHYFIRLRNKQYNYSNNPTFSNPENGSLVIADFRTNPRTYITTVGLYNAQNEMLAVAKLSKPVRKSFDEEILLRVRLDF